MKKAILILFFFTGLLQAQTPIDSLNVTPSTFQKRTCAFYSFSQNDTVSLTIYNNIGQNILNIKTDIILTSGYYQDSILLDSYPDGLYFTHLKLGKRKTIVKKIIKTALASVTELKGNFQFKTYPNPVSNVLHIESEQYFEVASEIEITNTLGQSVLKTGFKNEINVSEISQGFYNLKISTGNRQVYHSKIVKD